MSQLINKIKNYVNQKYLVKHVDNKHWQLVDNFENKVKTLLKEEVIAPLALYYPEINLDQLKATNPNEHKFLLHRASRYIYAVSNCLIDPDYNWVILGDKEIFRYSYPLVEDPWDRIKARPSVIGNKFKKTPTKLDKGILVKYGLTNYYHFFVDTLCQILMCDDNGIPADVPLIVPPDFNKWPFVADYLKEFPLKRKVIVQQKGQYLEVKELYVAKDTFFNHYTTQVKQGVIQKNIAAQSPEMSSPELLFITRKKGIRRSVSNTDELEQIARENGFEVVEPGGYTWKQQVKLFSNAKKIIGVHGAGLTNILFCNNPNLQLLEIFPGNGLHPEHYRNLSIALGYTHDSIEGNGLQANQQFTVDIELYKAAVRKLMST